MVHQFDITAVIAADLALRQGQVRNVINLLDEGNTIPFIARYRKEMTGELDETVLRQIAERLSYYRSLQERKEEVLRLIAEQGKLTEDLKKAIDSATKLQEVEDLYRPYKQKRRTRATIAREKGLEPLARIFWQQQEEKGNIDEIIAPFVQSGAGVETVAEARDGALDIIAEWIADAPQIRAFVREKTAREGSLVVRCKLEPDDSGKLPVTEYEIYYDFTEPLQKIPSHRVLAINRGEREKVLKVDVEAPVEAILRGIEERVITNPRSIFHSLLITACSDAYKRLIAPAVAREMRNQLTEAAEARAIEVFATNLRHLLLQPPVRGKRVMGIDPAYRTGCKVALVDELGNLLHTATIYPHAPQNRWQEAKDQLLALSKQYSIDVISIGNGTASRETEALVAEVIKASDRPLQYIIVNEAGASVYSASELAREEFPDLDVSMRGAVSIARRLQDPLAELVKIDPRSIGVGQYQHDVSQKQLAESLHVVVESCVNYVGVELNTASPALLQYVAGITSTVAKRIVQYRQKNGPFRERRQLLAVHGLGEKTYTQCAGFLRISDGDNPLDNTPVHPESYDLAQRILSLTQASLDWLRDRRLVNLVRRNVGQLDPEEVARQLGAGIPTVIDIIAALRQPGRDPREELPRPVFRQDVLRIEDLKPGMIVGGTISNVVDFGAFVDIGVKRNGLIHISELSDSYVSHPQEVVSVGDRVQVKILDVDLERERISLSLRL